MNEDPRLRRIWRARCALVAWICAVLASYFSYKAGCAGDTKAGVFGDPARALDIEGTSFALMLACVFMVVAAAMLSGSRYRLAHAFGFACLVFVSLWLVNAEVEAYGVKACFG